MWDGNQGPAWWFALVGHSGTNVGMARFLALPLVFIVVFGIIMWALMLQ